MGFDRVLDLFDALVKRRGSSLASATWERLLRLLLGAADGVLHSSKGALGNHLCGQLTRILFEISLRSLPVCGSKSETWNLLQKFCRRWIHRLLVIEQWNVVTLALTKSLMKQLSAPDASKEVEIVWVENRLQSKIECVSCALAARDDGVVYTLEANVCGCVLTHAVRLEDSLLAYAWHRLLRVIGHASSITDPDVYLAAIVRTVCWSLSLY